MELSDEITWIYNSKIMMILSPNLEESKLIVLFNLSRKYIWVSWTLTVDDVDLFVIASVDGSDICTYA